MKDWLIVCRMRNVSCLWSNTLLLMYKFVTINRDSNKLLKVSVAVFYCLHSEYNCLILNANIDYDEINSRSCNLGMKKCESSPTKFTILSA